MPEEKASIIIIVIIIHYYSFEAGNTYIFLIHTDVYNK